MNTESLHFVAVERKGSAI